MICLSFKATVESRRGLPARSSSSLLCFKVPIRRDTSVSFERFDAPGKLTLGQSCPLFPLEESSQLPPNWSRYGEGEFCAPTANPIYEYPPLPSLARTLWRKWTHLAFACQPALTRTVLLIRRLIKRRMLRQISRDQIGIRHCQGFS